MKPKSLRNAFQAYMHIKIITQACEFPQIMCNRAFLLGSVSYLGGTFPDYNTTVYMTQSQLSV